MVELIQIIFLLIHVAFVLFLFYLTLAFASAAPFVPSNKKATISMIELADIKKGMTVIDLGSGDGRILLSAASKGANAIGYEINPFLVYWTKLRSIWSNHRSCITVRWMSLWKADISNADVLFVYLLPNKLTRLQKKILNECKPGTVVVSNSFIFKDWNIDKQNPDTHIYRFLVPQTS